MVDPLLVGLALINIYIVALFLLHRRGKLRGPEWELVGPILMWRTEHGKRIIEWLSKAVRAWKVYGDVGVVVTWVSGVAVLLLLVWNISLFYTRPDLIKQTVRSPEYYLVLPGVNPLIPIWYGILGLVVALVVHEGAHGVLARAHKVKVKSLGLLFIVVPLGAFVEPDEEDMEKASTRTKNRIFAAGVMTNVAFALGAAIVFSAVMWGAVQPAHDGMAVANVVPLGAGLGAQAAGITAGMIITAVDDQPIRTVEDYNRTISERFAYDTVSLTLYSDGQTLQRQVKLEDKYAYYERTAPEQNNESYRGHAFLGINTFPMSFLGGLVQVMRSPLSFGLMGVGSYVALPFQGLSPVPAAYEHFFTIQGPIGAFPAPLFWVLTNSLYWIFWLNLMVGTFNALPAGPLDGGQMFKATLRGLLRKRYRVSRENLVVEKPMDGRQVLVRGYDAATQKKIERVESLVRGTTLAVGLVILALILAPIVGPQFLQ